MFLWLGLALFVDGIDGSHRAPAPRQGNTAQLVRRNAGQHHRLCHLRPNPGIRALPERVSMGAGLSFLSGGDHRRLQRDLLCRHGHEDEGELLQGLPVVWNMVVFTLFVAQPSEWMSFAVVLACAVFTFAPVNFLHPVRVKRPAWDQPDDLLRLVRLRQHCAAAGAGFRLAGPGPESRSRASICFSLAPSCNGAPTSDARISSMAKAIRIHECGGSDRMVFDDV